MLIKAGGTVKQDPDPPIKLRWDLRGWAATQKDDPSFSELRPWLSESESNSAC